MVISRAEIYWADLGPPSGSQPAKRRPVLVIQSDPYNASRLATVIAAVITSNTALAAMPGNVFLPATTTRLHVTRSSTSRRLSRSTRLTSPTELGRCQRA